MLLAHLRRLINAIRNRYVRVIGHPTGRLIGRRKGYEFDMEEVLKAAADYGCFLELNGQPDRRFHPVSKNFFRAPLGA